MRQGVCEVEGVDHSEWRVLVAQQTRDEEQDGVFSDSGGGDDQVAVVLRRLSEGREPGSSMSG